MLLDPPGCTGSVRGKRSAITNGSRIILLYPVTGRQYRGAKSVVCGVTGLGLGILEGIPNTAYWKAAEVRKTRVQRNSWIESD